MNAKIDYVTSVFVANGKLVAIVQEHEYVDGRVVSIGPEVEKIIDTLATCP